MCIVYNDYKLGKYVSKFALYELIQCKLYNIIDRRSAKSRVKGLKQLRGRKQKGWTKKNRLKIRMDGEVQCLRDPRSQGGIYAWWLGLEFGQYEVHVASGNELGITSVIIRGGVALAGKCIYNRAHSETTYIIIIIICRVRVT